MRRFLIILFGFVFGTTAPLWAQDATVDEAPFDNSTQREDGQIIAFVGRKVFVREDERPSVITETDENGEDTVYIIMDTRYEARYEILDLVTGDYAGDTIDFHAYDHYGIPRFSKSKNVLIFVHDRPVSRVHSKYNFYEVHRTEDGDWAACGDAYVQYDSEEEEQYKEPLEPISFLEPIIVNVPSLKGTLTDYFDEDEVITDADRAEAQAEIDEYYEEDSGLYKAPIWKREGDTATCQLGTRVRDLYEFQNQTRFLPEKREDICYAQWVADGKPDNNFIDDCIDLMNIQNLP